MSRRFYVSLASLTLFLVCVFLNGIEPQPVKRKITLSTLLPYRLHNQPVQKRSTNPTQVPPLTASASNIDSKHLDGTKTILPAGTPLRPDSGC